MNISTSFPKHTYTHPIQLIFIPQTALNMRKYIYLILPFLLLTFASNKTYGQCASTAIDWSMGGWASVSPACTQTLFSGTLGLGAGSYAYHYNASWANSYVSIYIASNGANINCANFSFYSAGDVGPYTNCLNTWGTALAPAGTDHVKYTTSKPNTGWNTSSALVYYMYQMPGNGSGGQTVATPAFSVQTTSICRGSSATYTINAMTYTTSYVWSLGGAGGTINSGQGTNSINVTFPTAGTTTVNVYATNNSKCNSNTATSTVTVSAPSVAGSFVTTLYNCQSTTGNLYNAAGVLTTPSITGNTGSTISWYYGTGNPATNLWANSNSTTAPGACCFTGALNSVNATVTNGACPSATVNQIFATIAPVAPTGGSVSPTSGCVSQGTITLTYAGGSTGPVAGGSYQWFMGSCGGFLVGTGQSLVLPAPGSTTNYYVRTVDVCGVASACYGPITYTVTQNYFGAGAIAADQSVCQSPGPVAFTSSNGAVGGNGTYTYTWQSSTDNVSFADIGGANATTYTPPATAGTRYYRRKVSETGGCNTSPVYTGQAQNVAWTAVPSTITVNGSTIKRTTTNGDTWDVGAYSLQKVTKGGYVQFQAGENASYKMIGLTSDPAADQSYCSIDYAWYPYNGGGFQVYENCGNPYGNVTAYSTADVWRVEWDEASNRIQYKRNGVLMYTSLVVPTVDLWVDLSLYTNGASFTNVVVQGDNNNTVVVEGTPVAPTLSVANPVNGTLICPDFNTGTVTGAAGSGGVADQYQVSINNGSTYAAYTNGAAIVTTGATGNVIVQARRTGSLCATTAWTTLCTWPVASPPTAPTLSSASPANGTTICAGFNTGTVTGTAGSGGGTGAVSEFQVSINNGGSYSAYTNGAAITTTGATGNVIVQARRTGGTGGGCTTTAWSTICTWPVGSAPVAPTLSAASPVNGSTICAGFNTGTVTGTGGSGGSTGAANEYQISSNGGGSYVAYTNGAAINTAGATTSIIVQGRRTGGSYGCTTTAWVTLSTWTVGSATVNPTLNTATPVSGTPICAGFNGPNATINAGSGGSSGAADTYERSLNNGGAWAAYASGSTINTTGATTNVLIRVSRSAGSYGCVATGPTTIVTWPVVAQPVAPTLSAASPVNGSTICADFNTGTVTGAAGSGGSTGAADEYQVSINGGGSWAAYSNGTAITTTGATTSVIVQSRRVAGTNGCNTTAWGTICTWTVGSAPVAPTLSAANAPNSSTICAGYNIGTVTGTAGSGGSTGAVSEFQVSINGGSTYAAYTNGAAIVTTGATGSVIVQSRRTGGSYGCTTTAWGTICTWTVGSATVNPTLNTATPVNGTPICAGFNGPNATINAGSGGSSGAADTYERSLNNGGTWAAYTSGSTINTTGATTNVLIRVSHSAGSYGCVATGPTTIVTWPVVAQPVAPTLSASTPANGSAICEGTIVTATGTAGSGGSTGSTDEYQYSIDNGSTYAAYTSGASIATLGGVTSVIVQSRRVAGTFGCNTTAWGTIASWPMNPKPADPTVTTPVTACGLYNITPVIGTNGNTCRFYGPSPTFPLLATGTSYTVSTVGTSTINVTSYNSTTGCESNMVPVVVTITATFSVNMTSTLYNGFNISCNGGVNGNAIATLSGGSPVNPITYYWSTGTTNTVSSSTNTITGLQAATYNVIAIDNVGCGALGTITLTQPTEMFTTLTPSDFYGWEISCNGSSDGSVTTSVTGGSGGNGFSWSSSPGGFSSTAQNPTGMTARTYTVLVTNNNGCTNTTSVVMNQPAAITFSTVTGYTCSGSTYTSATVTVNPVGGASTTYNYRMDGGAWQASNAFTLLANGSTHSFEVRDAVYTTCTSASSNVTITFPASGTAVDACNFIYVSPTGTSGTGTSLGQKSCTVDLPTAILIYNATPARNHILMQSGAYTVTGTLSIPGGLTIDGGYTVSGTDWIKNSSSATTITMNPNLEDQAGYGHHIAIRLTGNNVTLKDLAISVLPGGISGSYNSRGKSVYGIYISGQTGLVMTRCSITTTAATTGDAGAAPSGSGGGGAGGGNGFGGGSGGGCSSCGANGSAGAIGNGGSAGGGGGARCCSSGCNWYGCNSNGCTASNGGGGATGSNGSTPGIPANTGGLSTYYYPVDGANGTAGFGGGGGGGGGGGAYGTCCSCGCGPYNAQGGNGGSGGTGGLGGNAGYGGGGSFCIYANTGTGTLTDVVLNPGGAGAGGAGAAGRGGTAGSAGWTGSDNRPWCDGGKGGDGGRGGNGGTGGTGSNGATGISAGIQNVGGANVTRTGTTIPADGTVTVNWFAGCKNSQIDITKTSGSVWTNIGAPGADPGWVDNTTDGATSYTTSSNGSIYYPTSSATGAKNISLGSTTLTSFIRINGDRLNVISNATISSTVVVPTCPTLAITLASNLTGGQLANVTQHDWKITLVSTPTVNVYTSTAANPGSVPAPVGDWIEGATYQVRYSAYEVCCGWSTPAYISFTMANNLASVATVTPTANPCAGTTATYTASAVSGATAYNWTVTGGVINSGQGTTAISVTWGSAATGRTISVYPSNSCTAFNGSATTNTYTVKPNPTVTVTGGGIVCTPGGALTLVASAASGGTPGTGVFTYSWPAPGSGTAQTYLASAAGTYSVIVTEGGSGCTATDNQVVTTAPKPAVPAAGSQTACLGGTIPNVTATPTGGTGTETVDWYNSPSAGTLLLAGNTSYPTGQTAAGTYTYYAESRNTTSGCVSATRTTVTLTINTSNQAASTWDGSTDRDWFKPDNWNNCVPGPATVTTIPDLGASPPANYPQINSSQADVFTILIQGTTVIDRLEINTTTSGSLKIWQ